MTTSWRVSEEMRAEGAPVSPDLARTIEQVLVPRLLLAHRAAPQAPAREPAAIGAPVVPADLEGFTKDLLGSDDGAASARVRALLAGGVSSESIMLDLLAPTARHMGELWDIDECDFVAVTVALGRIQRALHDITGAQALRGSGGDHPLVGKVLLTCADGEQHLLGLLIAAEFFARDEWEVLLGPPVAPRHPLVEVQRDSIDVVGFSVGSERRLSDLAALVTEIRRVSRNPHVKIIVGGPCFDQHPDAWREIGADGVSLDAREAPRIARGFLPTADRPLPS
jgi:methanogenic corrinoid protein MtbC1